MDPIVGLLLLAAYMLPAIVAWNRRHRQEMAISVLNLLAGWTVIGWVGALVWACTTDVEAWQPRKSLFTSWREERWAGLAAKKARKEEAV